MELHSSGQLPDRDLIRRLYWEAPSLSIQAVYEAFGLRSPNDVSAMAGHRTFELPCRNCGTLLTHQVKNRTQLAKLRSKNLCEPCRGSAEERERQRRAALETEWRRHNREEADELHRAMQAYVLANPDLPEEPDGMSMYVDIPVSEWGGTTVRLRDLNLVRRELAEQLNRGGSPATS